MRQLVYTLAQPMHGLLVNGLRLQGLTMALDTSPKSEFAQAVYAWLIAVPAGQVTSYGQLARLAGHPRHARFVGRLMANLPQGSKLPWWRVVRSDGTFAGTQIGLQKERLRAEGVWVTASGVRLKTYGFEPFSP